MHQAAVKRRNGVVELLIGKGLDVNAKDEDGDTPLHYTTDQGQKEIAELLIARGADVNAKKANGKTPLDWAKASSSLFGPLEDKVKAAKKETTDLLRKHGGKTGDELKAEGK